MGPAAPLLSPFFLSPEQLPGEDSGNVKGQFVPEESRMEPTTMMSIVKNSTIPVNVDDLGPGLIIATYIHSNGSLYQGVLLQLNRE